MDDVGSLLKKYGSEIGGAIRISLMAILLSTTELFKDNEVRMFVFIILFEISIMFTMFSLKDNIKKD